MYRWTLLIKDDFNPKIEQFSETRPNQDSKYKEDLVSLSDSDEINLRSIFIEMYADRIGPPTNRFLP